jgi:hypothetical protein
MEVFIKIVIKTCLSLVLFVFVYPLLYFFGPDSIVFYLEQKQGELIIGKIEEFRSTHNRLPTQNEFYSILNNLSLHKKDESCPCYNQNDNYRYYIWYSGKSVGESFMYDSKTREWGRRG